MRICKVWDADYPWDVRVEKVSHSLAMAGHEVHLVCRNEARRERREWNGTFTIHRLPVLPFKNQLAHAAWNFPYPLNPAWISNLTQVVRHTKPDVILVRDILLSLPSLAIGKLYGIPVVLDMAENYPAMLKDRRHYNTASVWENILRNPSLARLVERISVRFATHVIVVVEESRDRLIGLGVPPNRISIVSNTPILDRWALNAGPEIVSSCKTQVDLVYLGNLDGSRGVDTAIRAVARLKEAGNLVHFHVIGDGPSRSHLEYLARALNVTEYVDIFGRLPFSKVQSIIATSDIGLIPHYATDAWNATIPNKLFDYMLVGMPVIVSDVKPTARIVRTENCGEVYWDRDDADLARCVMALRTPEARRIKGANGRSAILRSYNWGNDSKVLLEVVDSVYRQGRRMK